MDTASNGSITAQVCASLHSQLGTLFECLPAGERVQIRTPFTYPDGDLIDLYWRDTPQGQVVSDLETGPESHWPGFALRQADVLQSYTAS